MSACMALCINECPCLPGCFYMTLCLCIPVCTGGCLVMTGFVTGYMSPALHWCFGLVTFIGISRLLQAQNQITIASHSKAHPGTARQTNRQKSFIWECPGLVTLLIISQACSQANTDNKTHQYLPSFMHCCVYLYVYVWAQKYLIVEHNQA